MKYFATLLLLFSNFVLFAKGDGKETIKVDNESRSYYIHKPVGYAKGKSYPLVIVLHGGGQSGSDMISFTGFDKKADRDTVLVVYPNALENHWDDGRKPETVTSSTPKNHDDVKFISVLIDEMIAKHGADKERIYITGIANGGMMCYRLACELSTKIMAIAPVLGSMTTEIYNTCKPTRAISILAFNGEDDPVVPFAGGDVTFDGLKLGKVEPVMKSINFWANYGSDVKAIPFRVKKKDIDRTDGTTIITETFSNNKFQTEVVLYNVKNGGHAWPGAPQLFPASITGKVSREVDASEVIWEFFKNVY